MNQKQFDFPTEVLDLPSKGKLYPKEHPLSSGQITIKYMTAKEEDILSSTNLIKKGIVLDKLFESIIVDAVNIDDILVGDKNAIVLATRLLGYGPNYNISFYSSKAGKSIETTVDLAQIKTKDVDYSNFGNQNEFQFTTPTGNTLVFKLLTHGDEKLIDKDITALEKMNKDGSYEITTRLRYMIKSVDGNSDLGHINKFINNSFLAKDSRAFREHIKKISPDMNMTFTYVHEDGESEVAPIPMGVGFFWPGDES
jgi:hypothetical protein